MPHPSDDQPRDHGKFGNRPNSDAAGFTLAPTLAGEPVPVIEVFDLTHVGSRSPSEKGTTSYEGQGLSVSQHPDAWARIARLGGPVWNVSGDTNRFLDYHELTDAQKSAIDAWGVERGYITPVKAWKISTWDEDEEDYRWFLTTKESEVEFEREEAEYAEVETKFEVVATFAATETFADTTVKAGDLHVEQILATVWVQETDNDFEGVWWEDDYDPDNLSAPRGVIVPKHIKTWVASATPRT